MYRVTALNVTRIWIELAVWAAMVSTAQFSLSGSRLLPSPGKCLTSPAPAVKHGPLVMILVNVAVFSGIRQLPYDIEIIAVAKAH